MNQKDNRKCRYIYQQSAKAFVEVEESVFKEFYRFTKRERYVLQKEDRCTCPQSYIMYCDCDCEICPYHTQPFTIRSQNQDVDEYEPEDSDGETIEDELAFRQLQAMVDKVSEVYPDARRIIMLRYQGLSDSEIERITGIGRHTFQNRLKKALQQLGFKAEDYR